MPRERLELSRGGEPRLVLSQVRLPGFRQRGVKREWSTRQESNLRRSTFRADALPAELPVGDGGFGRDRTGDILLVEQALYR